MRNNVRVIHLMLAVVLLMPVGAPVAEAQTAPDASTAHITVSVDYQNAPLALVLQTLADAAGLNLLLDHTVTGHVTLTLHDHAAIDAIRLITRLNGYEYELVGNTIIVAAPQRLEQLLVTEHALYALQYVETTQAASMLSRLFPKLTVVEDTAQQRLILTGSATDLASATAFLNDFDQSGARPRAFVRAPLEDVVLAIADSAGWHVVLQGVPDVSVTAAIDGMDPHEAMKLVADAAGLQYRLDGTALYVRTEPTVTTDDLSVETRIVRLDYADPDQAGTVLNSMWPTLAYSVDTAARAIVLQGTPTDVNKAEAFLRQYDFAPGQVYVEARVEEISLEALRRLGVDWTVPNLQWSGSELASAALSWHPAELRTTLELLNETGEATILASPRLAALDGREARILIGDRIPLIMTETTPDGQTRERLEYIEAGISLEIIPTVGQDGYIVLDIVTEISSITGTTAQHVPQIRTREATTRIRVKDGQPLVIAGLIQDEERLTTRGLPWVQDLPLIGSLFRNQVADRVQSETVIFLIPHIVRDETGPAQPPTSMFTGEAVAMAQPRSPLPVPASVAPAALSRSVRFDINGAIAGAGSIEVERAAGNSRLLSRFYVTASGPHYTWGIGLGVRRYIPNTALTPWVDFIVDRIQPPGSDARVLLSARLGGQARLGSRLYLEPYVDYTVLPWENDPNWSVPGHEAGLGGGFRLGWRY